MPTPDADELELPADWDTSGLAAVARDVAPAPGPSAPIEVPRGTVSPIAPIGTAGIAEMQRARAEYQENMAALRQRQQELMAAREKAGAPIQSRIEALAAQPIAPPPAPPTLPAPPPREFRPFLAGTPGESASKTLNRVLLGLGTMAMQAAGIFNGFPQGALRAFTGALQGWSAGDRQRGDAEFQNWKNQVDHAQTQWRDARQEFADTLAVKHASLEDLQASLKGVAQRYDMPLKMTELIEKDITSALKLAENWGKTLVELDTDAARLDMQRGIAESNERLRETTQRGVQEHRAAQLDQQRLAREERAAQAAAVLEERRTGREESIALRRELAGQSADLRRELAADRAAKLTKLPAKAVEDMQDIRGVVAALDKIEQTYDPAFVGPVAGRAGELRRRGGVISPQESEFRSALAELNNMLLKVRSGAAVTPQEFERLQKELPIPNDGPQDFVTKRARARQSWSDTLGRKAETWGAQGYFVSPALGSVPETPVPAPREKQGDAGRQVRVRRRSDGAAGTLKLAPGEQVPAEYEVVK